MLLLRKSDKKVSSRQQINIETIDDGVLGLPGGKYRAILQVSPVNYELRSEEEQDMLLEAYKNFLNSLDCSLQTLVRIRELDVGDYISNLEERLNDEGTAIYQTQIQDYLKFLKKLVSDNRILTRYFYIVIQCDLKEVKDLDALKQQILLECEVVAKGLMRLGIKSNRLDSIEVLELFHSFYSPLQARTMSIKEDLVRSLYTYHKSVEST